MQEDTKIINLVGQYGRQWKFIARYIPNRTGVQCKGRWLDTLLGKNDVKWSKDEVSIDNLNVMEIGILLICMDEFRMNCCAWRFWIRKKLIGS